jgi:hypothetical protein
MIWEEKSYVTCGSLMTTIGWRRCSAWWNLCWRRWPSACVQRSGRRAMMKNLKKRARSHEDHFPKILFVLSWCGITKDDGSRDLFSWSQMHVDEQDEVALSAQQQRRQKPRCGGGSWLFVVTSSVAAARIYMEDPPIVIASHNRVAKINDKGKPRTCEALGRILMYHSRAHHLTSPRHARPSPVRRDERARMCASSFLLFSTLL